MLLHVLVLDLQGPLYLPGHFMEGGYLLYLRIAYVGTVLCASSAARTKHRLRSLHQRRIQPSAQRYITLYSVGPSRLKGECEHKQCGALALGGVQYHGLLSLPCLVLGFSYLLLQGMGGAPGECVILSNIMLDGGRARTGEDMPCEMVVAEFSFFFPVLAHRLGVACLVLHTSGACSARKILCCLLVGTRLFAQLQFRRPGRSVDSLGQPWRAL